MISWTLNCIYLKNHQRLLRFSTPRVTTLCMESLFNSVSWFMWRANLSVTSAHRKSCYQSSRADYGHVFMFVCSVMIYAGMWYWACCYFCCCCCCKPRGCRPRVPINDMIEYKIEIKISDRTGCIVYACMTWVVRDKFRCRSPSALRFGDLRWVLRSVVQHRKVDGYVLTKSGLECILGHHQCGM